MTKPKILVSRRWPEAVETAMKEKYDVTFNISDKPLSTNEFKEALSVYDAILPTVTDNCRFKKLWERYGSDPTTARTR